MSIQKSNLQTQTKTYEIPEDFTPKAYPTLPNSGADAESFHKYLQYRSLEYRQDPPVNPDALGDLDGMMDDLTDQGSDFFPASKPQAPTQGKPSVSEIKKEVKVLRRELDSAKAEIRKAGLESEMEKTFMDRLTELYGRLYDKGSPLDSEGIREDLGALKEDLSATVEEKRAVEEEGAKNMKDFKNEVEDAKREFKKSVEANKKLSPTVQQALIQDFNGKADALANGKDVEKARQDLRDMVTEMNPKVETSVDEREGEKKTQRDALYKDLSGFTQASRFRETQGHWWQKGIELGEKFLSAVQTNNWADFKTQLSKLEGNQRWVCVMRVVTAIYRIAGKNEAKAIEMLNNFVPKDVVQAMRDSVMSEPQNMDWGNGDKNECGPEGLVEWNIPTTADFLSRSLTARKDVDPYEVHQTAS